MQKYRADSKSTQPDGAVVWRSKWLGGPSLAKIDNCRLESLAGDMRRTVYLTGEPDTFFSVPAVCRLAGCRVRGYVTIDDGNLVFRHVYSRPFVPRRLNKAQRAELRHIVDCVNDGTIQDRRAFDIMVLDGEAPEWFLDWPLWSAGENMPGYMPDSPYSLFMTERAARGYCRELERQPGGRDYVSDFMQTSLREIFG